MDHPLELSLIVVAGYFAFAASTHALTLSEWKATRFSPAGLSDPALSGDSADPDGDGRKNLLEYALGGEPLVPDQAPVQAVAGPDGLALHFPERVVAGDLLYHLSESPDLHHWLTPNSATPETLSENGTIRMVAIPLSSPSADRTFARLQVFLSAGAVEWLIPPSHPSVRIEVPLTVIIGWNDNARIEEGFAIERRLVTGGVWEEIGTGGPDTSYFQDLDIVGTTEYTYRVSALQGEYASEPSAEIALTTPLDSDQDSLPDDLEAAYGTDPMRFSSANNGVPDGWWIRHGLDPAADGWADSDGDGRSDAEEFYDSTDPWTSDQDPSPGDGSPSAPIDLVVESLEDGRFLLTWTNQDPGALRNIVERTSDGSVWERVGVVRAYVSAFTDATTLPDQDYFYRIVARL